MAIIWRARATLNCQFHRGVQCQLKQIVTITLPRIPKQKRHHPHAFQSEFNRFRANPIQPKNQIHFSLNAAVLPTNMARHQSSPENLILVNREPTGIAFVTINRPKSLNSLPRPMMTDLAQAFKALDQDESVRVIVLSGSGRAFCSGVDLTSAEDVFKGDVKDVESDPVSQMERCRKPIIGAINGFAVTAGFEIALACDIIIATKGAKFMDTHARSVSIPSFISDFGSRIEVRIGTQYL